MTDHYAVLGNPIAHSKSPRIHAEFARQTGQDMDYQALLAPLDDFAGAVTTFRQGGGCGANVTVPFKFQAFLLTHRRSDRAELARAVNTLRFDGDKIYGDNTDGVGLVRDLQNNLGQQVEGRRVLMLGAGGAAFGVLHPLLMEAPARLVISNRTIVKAEQAAVILNEILSRVDWPHERRTDVVAINFAELADEKFDVVINATSASLSGDMPPLPTNIFNKEALAYDMMYGRDTPFLAFAREQGARTADGLGMLVEQAAEAFFLWRGVRPLTAPVMAMLRNA